MANLLTHSEKTFSESFQIERNLIYDCLCDNRIYQTKLNFVQNIKKNCQYSRIHFCLEWLINIFHWGLLLLSLHCSQSVLIKQTSIPGECNMGSRTIPETIRIPRRIFTNSFTKKLHVFNNYKIWKLVYKEVARFQWSSESTDDPGATEANLITPSVIKYSVYVVVVEG